MITKPEYIDFMKEIKEFYKEIEKAGTMITDEYGKPIMKAELQKIFVHRGKLYDIPLGWDVIKTGKIQIGDRAFIGGDKSRFLPEEETLKLVGSSAKDRICIIRKMTKKEIKQATEKPVKKEIIRIDKSSFLKAIKEFIGEI